MRDGKPVPYGGRYQRGVEGAAPYADELGIRVGATLVVAHPKGITSCLRRREGQDPPLRSQTGQRVGATLVVARCGWERKRPPRFGEDVKIYSASGASSFFA